MNINNIFNFDFTDRNKEKEIFDNFINGLHSSNILWIHGSSGVGKSFFIKSILQNYKIKQIYTNVEYNQENNICLIKILKELQMLSKMDFIEFIKTNYKSILDTTKKITSQILKLGSIDLEWLSDIVFDNSKIFLDEYNKKQTITKIITSYIEKIISQNDLVIVLDNFMWYDINTFDSLVQIATYFQYNEHLKIIFLTTDDFQNDKCVKFLTEQVDALKLKILPWTEQKYFSQILIPKFNNSSELVQYMPMILEYCQGKPELLKSLLRNLYFEENGFYTTHEGNLNINLKHLENYLKSGDAQFELGLLNEHELFILQIIVSLKTSLDINLLEVLLQYLYKYIFKNPVELSKIFILKSIDNLINGNIVKRNDNILLVKHDLIYLQLSKQFDNSLQQELIDTGIYNFLCENRDITLLYGLSKSQYDFLYAQYAYKTRSSGWIKSNYNLGIDKFNNGAFIESAKIFQRLSAVYHELNDEKKIIIGVCYYKAGFYADALTIFKIIEIFKLNDSSLFCYYYYFGKSNFITLNNYEAINLFKKADEFYNSDHEHLMAINMMILASRETIDDPCHSKELFEQITLNVEKYDIKSFDIAMSSILRNSIFFTKNFKAKNFLDIAKKIAIYNENYLEIAYVANNTGYTFLLENDIKGAMRCYEESYDILKTIRIHETSYCLNNLAVCNMLNEDYENAIHLLNEALFWNRSSYTYLCIKTHMMICNLYLGMNKNAQNIAEQLYSYISNQNVCDLIIKRRILINLCIVYKELDNIEKARKYINEVFPIINDSLSYYRGTILMNELCETSHKITNKQRCIHDSTLKFEPWIVMHSHD